MKCNNCGFECESKFCPECGNKMEVQKPKCPNCGLESESKYCPECGAAMRTSLKLSQISEPAVSPNVDTENEVQEPSPLPYGFDMHTMDNIAKIRPNAFLMKGCILNNFDFSLNQAKEIAKAYCKLKPHRPKASAEEKHKAMVELGIAKNVEVPDKPNMINGVPVCPKCGSKNVYIEKVANADSRKNLQKGFAFYGSIAYNATANCITCTECGHFWNV